MSELPARMACCSTRRLADLFLRSKVAQNRADGVWNPILEARLKADRLGSTLSIFERSKFFFTLPGALKDSIAAVRP